MSELDIPPVRWRLRPALRFEPAVTAGRYQVQDPASGERFELGKEEVFLCQALDRGTDSAAIQAGFAQQFGLTLTAEQLEQFYQDMAALGLLEPVAPEIDPLDPEEDDRPGDPYRWTFFDPQRGFVRLAKQLNWMRHSVWLLIPGVPLALLTLLYNQPAYQHALQSLSDPGWHLLFKLVFGLFVVNLFSKVAQGAVCVHYGGRAEQFGIRLAYGLIPRFFVARRLRSFSRHQRLWVAAAALLAKLGLFVGGALLWRLTLESGGALGAYGFVLSHMALVAFLFTVNPLWRADGYTWLVAWLAMPRLRERAFLVLGLYLRGRRPPQGLAGSEKYGLLGYAMACAIYVLLLAGFVMFSAALQLESRFQGVGVVLFLGLLFLVSRWSLHRLQGRQQRSEKRPSRSAEHVAPNPPRSAAPGLTAAGNPHRRWRLAVLAVLIGGAFLPYPYDVTGEVTLFPIARAEIHAVTSGVVAQAPVRENQWVAPAETLAELSTWQQDHELAVIAASIERQQAELALLQHGAKAEAIDLARQQWEMAKIRAVHSRKVQQLLAPVHQQGVVKDLEYGEAVKTAELDEAGVGVAEANLRLIKSPPLPMEVAVQQAELRQLAAQLAYLRDQRERARLRTPLAGRIVTPRLEFKIGSFLKEGDLFAAVEDNRVMRAEILAPEIDIGVVQAEASVRLRVWAYPLRDFTGRVAAIAPVVETNPDNPFVRAVRVTIEIPNPDGLLKSQMTGVAKIAAGDQPLIVAFTRALVRFVMIEMWSWLP
ncbi:MAG: efflux RND transporter periplasmic adaptor subunit [Candidatus Competibacteraceae bacterium]